MATEPSKPTTEPRTWPLVLTQRAGWAGQGSSGRVGESVRVQSRVA